MLIALFPAIHKALLPSIPRLAGSLLVVAIVRQGAYRVEALHAIVAPLHVVMSAMGSRQVRGGSVQRCLHGLLVCEEEGHLRWFLSCNGRRVIAEAGVPAISWVTGGDIVASERAHVGSWSRLSL